MPPRSIPVEEQDYEDDSDLPPIDGVIYVPPTENEIRAEWGLPPIEEDIVHHRTPGSASNNDWVFSDDQLSQNEINYAQIEIERLRAYEECHPSPSLNTNLKDESEPNYTNSSQMPILQVHRLVSNEDRTNPNDFLIVHSNDNVDLE